MRTNSIPFLELQDAVRLDFEDITKEIQLTKITQKQNELEIEAVEYEEYKPNTEHFENQKSNLFDESYLNNGYVEWGNIKYPTDKPPAPINLIPENLHLGIGTKWDKVNRDDIQEYIVYMKGITEDGHYTGLNLKFSRGNSTYFLANAEPGFYEIKVSCITMAGMESDQSAAVIAKSLEITGEQIGVDGDTIVVDTGSKKLILGTV
ncbi:fibronectin type III domain-containing protein, partial [Sebaldella sp. S0638]